MSDELIMRVARLEERFSAAEARAEERHAREKRMEEKIDLLLTRDGERRGREAAERRDRDDRHDDRWQVWIRALFPVAIITAAANALIAWFNAGGPK